MPTMKEIAKRANVSVAAVSVVLNNKKSRISKAKKAEIKQIAKDLNYHPNIAAVTLSKNISLTIGLIVPDITNPFFATLTRLIEQQLGAQGYSTLFVDSNNSFTAESDAVQNMVSRGVDGIVLVPSNEFFLSKKKERKALIEKSDKPIVLLNAYTDLKVSYVNFDNVQGAYLATQELINYGHTHIAFIRGKANFVNAAERLEGYRQALKDNRIAFNDDLVFEGDYTLDSGAKLAPKILEDPETTAILSANDLMLFGVIKWAKQNFVDIFSRVSMVGFDNDPYGEIIEVPLTTVDQQPLEMVNETIDLLLEMLTTGEKVVQHLIVKPKLIKRSSIHKIEN